MEPDAARAFLSKVGEPVDFSETGDAKYLEELYSLEESASCNVKNPSRKPKKSKNA